MEEKSLHYIARYVQERAGLQFSGHKKRLLRQRLEERLSRLGLAGLEAYRNILVNSENEGTSLLELLTTNETSFFRNPRQFEYLTERIIPSLEEVKGREVMRSWAGNVPIQPSSAMKLRILCAGCSTGEEPYSVAMALLSALRYPRAWDIEILAGDLNETCLRVAQRGFYEEERLRGLPDVYRQRFADGAPGGITIKPEVQRLIRFSTMNLYEIIHGGNFPGMSAGFAGFDMIFCRNVMIYFSFACQQLLVDLMSRSLAPGGYLFTGDVEPLHLYTHDFVAVRDAKCLIYQKTETDADVKTA